MPARGHLHGQVRKTPTGRPLEGGSGRAWLRAVVACRTGGPGESGPDHATSRFVEASGLATTRMLLGAVATRQRRTTPSQAAAAASSVVPEVATSSTSTQPGSGAASRRKAGVERRSSPRPACRGHHHPGGQRSHHRDPGAPADRLRQPPGRVDPVPPAPPACPRHRDQRRRRPGQHVGHASPSTSAATGIAWYLSRCTSTRPVPWWAAPAATSSPPGVRNRLPGARERRHCAHNGATPTIPQTTHPNMSAWCPTADTIVGPQRPADAVGPCPGISGDRTRGCSVTAVWYNERMFDASSDNADTRTTAARVEAWERDLRVGSRDHPTRAARSNCSASWTATRWMPGRGCAPWATGYPPTSTSPPRPPTGCGNWPGRQRRIDTLMADGRCGLDRAAVLVKLHAADVNQDQLGDATATRVLTGAPLRVAGAGPVLHRRRRTECVRAPVPGDPTLPRRRRLQTVGALARCRRAGRRRRLAQAGNRAPGATR